MKTKNLMKVKFFIVILTQLVFVAETEINVNQVVMDISTSYKSKNDRIAGGVTAIPNEFPWMAYLESYTQFNHVPPPTNSNVCAGTLIDNRWILTSADCLDGKTKINVYLGAHDMQSQTEPYRVMYTSSDFIKHPSWTTGSSRNNIGLILLPTAVTLTDWIQPINLPYIDDHDHNGDPVTLAGWGTQTNTGTTSRYLNKVNSTVISIAECQAVYGNVNISFYDICSSGTNNVGTCQGDYGSPMMYHQENGVIVQIGLASFLPSVGCGYGYPSGFIRLSYYVDWIYSVTGIATLSTRDFSLSTTTQPSEMISSSTISQSVDGGTTEFPPDNGGSNVTLSPITYNLISAVALLLYVLHSL